MDISTSIRASAIIYADEPNTQAKITSIKRKFIEAVFVTNNNTELSLSELANAIQERFDLSFTEEELYSIIAKGADKYFLTLETRNVENKKASLIHERFLSLSTKEDNNNISLYIDNYLAVNANAVGHTSDAIKELLNKYFYELLNNNITAYSKLINPNKDQKSLVKVESKNFTADEIDIINDFLNWDNAEKNKAIFQLLSYALEYALVSNNAKDNVFLSSLRTKQFYLDTNLLYRALGINGSTRQKRTVVFLKKCQESGQKLIISLYTKKEFEESINYHISQLRSSQFGRINPAIFNRYCYGESIYQYYHEWRKNRITYSFDIFKSHLIGEYKKLLKSFDIDEDCKTPFESDKYDKTIEKYKDEIGQIKYTKRDLQHEYDARNLLWLEILRKDNNVSLVDTKYYFISTDQKLKQWDERHSIHQPLLLLPSQWMALILKYYSRTNDDFKSFVSFLNLPKNDSLLTENELQIVLAGISEITEDFDMQESIIEDMVATKFNGIIEKQDFGKTREQAKQFAKEKFEEEFTKKLAEKEVEKEKIEASTKEEIEKIRLEYQKLAQDALDKYNRDLLNEKIRNVEKEIKDYEKRERKADNKFQKTRNQIAAILVIGAIIYAGIMIYLSIKLGWEIMEHYVWIITFLPPILLYIYNGVTNKNWKWRNVIDAIHDRYRNKIDDSYDIDKEDSQELKNELFRLKQATARKTETE